MSVDYREEKPNVIFIMTDQQRADSFGPDRHPCADYPHMEALCEQSINFTNFFTASMPCGPSRNCFLTGQHAWQNGVNNCKFNTSGTESWMSALRREDYKCISVGKTHMIHSGSLHIPVELGDSFGEQGGLDHFNPQSYQGIDENYYDIAVTRRACEILEKCKGKPPFAMFIGLHAPHEPYVLPGKYMDYCSKESVELPETALHLDKLNKKSKSYLDRVKFINKYTGRYITDDDLTTAIATYHCMLKMIDDCLGIIIKKITECGLEKNTIVVFTSDHGDYAGDYRLVGKGATFHDQEVRLPMLIRLPDGRFAGEIRDQLASSIDFFPTIADLVGAKPLTNLPGRSLLPMIETNTSVRDSVLSYMETTTMYRTKNEKVWLRADGSGEMFNLEDDPLEMDNLFDEPEFRIKRAELIEKMLIERMKDDYKFNSITHQERLIREEVSVCNEPEVPYDYSKFMDLGIPF